MACYKRKLEKIHSRYLLTRLQTPVEGKFRDQKMSNLLLNMEYATKISENCNFTDRYLANVIAGKLNDREDSHSLSLNVVHLHKTIITP